MMHGQKNIQIPKCDLCYVKFACIRPSNVTLFKTELPSRVSGGRWRKTMIFHGNGMTATSILL
jgi:hypothetical protein